MRRLLMLCIIVGAAGCAAPQYAYRPAEEATAVLSGYPAARYAIPPERPEGDVRIATFGITFLDLRSGESVPALHVRLTVANDGGQTVWTADTREIRADMDGAGVVRPAFTNASAPGLPVIQIPPGQERTLDLYFRLPPGLEDAEDVPHFAVLWRVRTDERAVSERTPFDRIRLVPETRAEPYFAVGLGLSPYWWYDPFFYPRPIVVYRVRSRTRFIPRR